MTLLIFSEILLNFTLTFAIFLFCGLVGKIAYEILRFIQGVKKLSEEIRRESVEMYERVNKFFENMSRFAIFSRFFKGKKTKGRDAE